MSKTIEWLSKAEDDANALIARDERAANALSGAIHAINQNASALPVLEGTTAPDELRRAHGAWQGFNVTVVFRETPDEYLIVWVNAAEPDLGGE